MDKQILIVEDDPLVAMMLEEYLEALGCNCTATAENVDAALTEVRDRAIDGAIVDVYLSDGETSEAVAEALDAAAIPFLVATGGFISEPAPVWRGRKIVEKPFSFEKLEQALGSLFEH